MSCSTRDTSPRDLCIMRWLWSEQSNSYLHTALFPICTFLFRWYMHVSPKLHLLTIYWCQSVANSLTTNINALWKCHLVIFFPKVSQAPSKCFFKWINWINWIKSRIPRWNWKTLFVLSSYKFLAMLEGKIGECPFF